MSRIIKFRAWNKYAKVMTYRPRLDYDNATGEQICFSYDGDGKEVLLPLMQFTGLTDCNGVDIYEGDLLNVFYTSGDGEHIHDCVYAAHFGYLGIEFIFKSLLWKNYGWNQYPISTTLCERYDTLALMSDGLVIPNKYGRNGIHNHSWKENDRSNYFKVIGNIYEHQHLLDRPSETDGGQR